MVPPPMERQDGHARGWGGGGPDAGMGHEGGAFHTVEGKEPRIGAPTMWVEPTRHVIVLRLVVLLPSQSPPV